MLRAPRSHSPPPCTDPLYRRRPSATSPPSPRAAPPSARSSSPPRGALVLSVAMLAGSASAHRSGRIPLARPRRRLRRAAVAGCPAGRRCPARSRLVSLLVALLGMYWDISLHIDNGRDPGPLANPAHYLILVGLFGIFAAGFLAIVPARRSSPAPAAVRITGDWYAPLGGVLIAACGVVRADRLPARRHLAPALRPGRDALGPDPPDADRRRRA